MKQNFTILCEESLDVMPACMTQTFKNSKQNRSPFSKANSTFNFMNSTISHTPQSKNNKKDSYQFKSTKYVGIIEKNVLQRLKFYEQKNKEKRQCEQVSAKVKEQEMVIKQLKQKPQINQTSKELFQKVKRQKSLSPNILQRFQTYECQRVSRTAKYGLLKAQGMNITNTTFACRKNINERSKSRSPLRQLPTNQNRSRSKSATNLQRNFKNPSDIGRIVQKKHPTTYETHKQMDMSESYAKQIYHSLMSNQLKNMKKQFVTQQERFISNKKQQICEKFGSNQKDFKELTPSKMKKNPMSKKWKVIV